MSRQFSRVRLVSVCAGGLLVSIAMVACGETGAASAEAAPVADTQKVAAPQPLDIPTKSGTLTLMAPAGATFKIGSSIDVTAGPGFQIQINAGIGVLSRFKQDVESNTINVFKRFVLDEPPLGMVYESAVGGKPEYHMVFIVKGVMRGLVCRDAKGPVFTESQASAMYASCKSLALKP